MAETSSRSDRIWARVADAGPLRFDEFLDLALYDPDLGFYATHGRSGRGGGDFITSPSIGGLFGRCLAAFVDAEWDRLGQPADFTVVDVGAGVGALTRSLIAAVPRCLEVTRFVLVEISASQRMAHDELIEWAAKRGGSVESLASGDRFDATPIYGVVIGNELLDNLGVRVVAGTSAGGLVEAYVSRTRQMEWQSTELARPHGASVPADGVPFPVHERGATEIDRWVSRVAGGSVVMIDYGAETTAEIALRDGWLRTYAAHSVGTDPFESIGERDITVDVAFDQLPPPTSLQHQADSLRDWGLDHLVEQAKEQVDMLAASGGLDWIRARSVVSEASALTDPAGLGGFWVAIWSK